MQVLFAFGLFIHLYLLTFRLLPLGLLRDKLLRFCAVALDPLPATSVTLLRVPPLYRRRESLSSTPAAVLSTLSVLLSRMLSELLLRLLSRQLSHCSIR